MDPKFDELLDKIATEMNPEMRKLLIYQEHDYLRQTYAVMYLLRMGVIVGVSPKLDWWRLRVDEKYIFRTGK